MICQKCKNEMTIASSFLQTQENDGKTEIYSVIDLMCTDPQCPDGKKRIPMARDACLVTNETKQKNAVTCCGRPLIYVGEENYWIPDGADSEPQKDGEEISVTCKNCGSRHAVNIKDKQGV